MSLVSRAVQRLRELYRPVLLHTCERIARRSCPARTAVPLVRPCGVEWLEPRLLLDGGFGGREDVAVGHSPRGIVSADFDGDGWADLAVTNVVGDEVSVLYGLRWAAGWNIWQDVAVGNGPQGIVSADFDGDGRADLAVTNRLDDDVSVLYGGSYFQDRQDVAVGNGPCGIVSADFNGDGRADLAVTNVDDNDVSVLYGLSGGGFGAPQDVAVGNGPWGIVSADFNRDGRADLAVTNINDNDVSVLYGIPGGGFGAPQDVAVGNGPRGIVSADFDRDGRPDLAVTNLVDEDVSVLYGLSGGGFGARQDLAVGDMPFAIVSGGFEVGLGYPSPLDLAITNLLGGDVSALWRQMAGTAWDRLFPQRVEPVADLPFGIVSGDFNRDGRADLAVTNTGSDDVSVLYSFPGKVFTREDVAVGDGPWGIVSGDFNRDGRADLAVANADDDDVSILYGQGVCPLTLISPAAAEVLLAGQAYGLEWCGRDADTSVNMWSLGPTGYRRFAEDLVGSAGSCQWSSVGESPGWRCFIAQIQRHGETFLAASPGWLRVVAGGGQAAGAQTTGVSPQMAMAGNVLVPAGVEWVAPTNGTNVVQGDGLQLTWEIHPPSLPAATVELFVSSRAAQDWYLLAGQVEAATRSYLWDTSDYEPGEYRFGIRLHDGENLPDLVASTWVEVLASGIVAPVA